MPASYSPCFAGVEVLQRAGPGDKRPLLPSHPYDRWAGKSSSGVYEIWGTFLGPDSKGIPLFGGLFLGGPFSVNLNLIPLYNPYMTPIIAL